jgi:hypothetical protein
VLKKNLKQKKNKGDVMNTKVVDKILIVNSEEVVIYVLGDSNIVISGENAIDRAILYIKELESWEKATLNCA